MGYHDKYQVLDPLDSDVLIVSECASKEKLQKRGLTFPLNSFHWIGDNKNKGLAVIAKPPYKVTPLFERQEELPIWVGPFRVTTPQGRQIDLIAVWSFKHRDKRNLGKNPVVTALDRFERDHDSSNLIVAGDFNSDINWDKGNLSCDFRVTNARLSDSGLTSLYHSRGGHKFGLEPDRTYYYGEKSSHIDYIYAPKRWLEGNVTIKLGGRQLSDHVYLTADFLDVQ